MKTLTSYSCARCGSFRSDDPTCPGCGCAAASRDVAPTVGAWKGIAIDEHSMRPGAIDDGDDD